MSPRCWLARFSETLCDGRLVRCHLVAQQVLRKEFPHGAVRVREEGSEEARWMPMDPRLSFLEIGDAGSFMPMLGLREDPRCWVWGCGGPTGIGGHHGEFDYAKSLRVPRDLLPPEVEEFCAELGLGWYLDRTYGERTVAA